MKPSDRNESTVELNGTVFKHGEIFKVVDIFYSRVQADPLLKVPFQSVHDWPEHVERLTHFWWIKFGGQPYAFSEYNPVTKHFYAGFNQTFLSRWLELFHQTLVENLNPEQVKLWKHISESMGRGLTIKNEMYRRHVSQSDAE